MEQEIFSQMACKILFLINWTLFKKNVYDIYNVQ